MFSFSFGIQPKSPKGSLSNDLSWKLTTPHDTILSKMQNLFIRVKIMMRREALNLKNELKWSEEWQERFLHVVLQMKYKIGVVVH